jgi:NADH:ubiquinone oxidoreductase subunit H
MIVLSGLAVTLFLGGWSFPAIDALDRFGPIWFLAKLGVLITAFLVVLIK